MEKLRFFALLVVLAFPLEAAEVGRTAPGEVEVTLGSWKLEGGFVKVYGSVRNGNRLPISGQVRIEYLDADGKTIRLGDDGSASVPFYAPIAPGETGYFYRPRDVAKLSSRVAGVKVGLLYAVPEEKSPVALFSGTKWSVKDGLAFEGKVRNTGNTPCRMPSVAAVMMKGGKPVETSEPSLGPDELLAGQELGFRHETMAPPGIDAVSFVLDCSPLTFPR